MTNKNTTAASNRTAIRKLRGVGILVGFLIFMSGIVVLAWWVGGADPRALIGEPSPKNYLVGELATVSEDPVALAYGNFAIRGPVQPAMHRVRTTHWPFLPTYAFSNEPSIWGIGWTSFPLDVTLVQFDTARPTSARLETPWGILKPSQQLATFFTSKAANASVEPHVIALDQEHYRWNYEPAPNCHRGYCRYRLTHVTSDQTSVAITYNSQDLPETYTFTENDFEAIRWKLIYTLARHPWHVRGRSVSKLVAEVSIEFKNRDTGTWKTYETYIFTRDDSDRLRAVIEKNGVADVVHRYSYHPTGSTPGVVEVSASDFLRRTLDGRQEIDLFDSNGDGIVDVRVAPTRVHQSPNYAAEAIAVSDECTPTRMSAGFADAVGARLLISVSTGRNSADLILCEASRRKLGRSSVSFTMGTPLGLAIADADRDGITDAVLVGTESLMVARRASEKATTFGSPANGGIDHIVVDPKPREGMHHRFTDIDGDGLADLLEFDDNDTLRVWRGMIHSQASSPPDWGLPLPGFHKGIDWKLPVAPGNCVQLFESLNDDSMPELVSVCPDGDTSIVQVFRGIAGAFGTKLRETRVPGALISADIRQKGARTLSFVEQQKPTSGHCADGGTIVDGHCPARFREVELAFAHDGLLHTADDGRGSQVTVAPSEYFWESAPPDQARRVIVSSLTHASGGRQNVFRFVRDKPARSERNLQYYRTVGIQRSDRLMNWQLEEFQDKPFLTRQLEQTTLPSGTLTASVARAFETLGDLRRLKSDVTQATWHPSGSATARATRTQTRAFDYPSNTAQCPETVTTRAGGSERALISTYEYSDDLKCVPKTIVERGTHEESWLNFERTVFADTGRRNRRWGVVRDGNEEVVGEMNWDRDGRITSARLGGLQWSLDYDKNDTVPRRISRNGIHEQIERDPHTDFRVKTTDSDGVETSYAYLLPGLVRKAVITNAAGRQEVIQTARLASNTAPSTIVTELTGIKIVNATTPDNTLRATVLQTKNGTSNGFVAFGVAETSGVSSGVHVIDPGEDVDVSSSYENLGAIQDVAALRRFEGLIATGTSSPPLNGHLDLAASITVPSDGTVRSELKSGDATLRIDTVAAARGSHEIHAGVRSAKVLRDVGGRIRRMRLESGEVREYEYDALDRVHTATVKRAANFLPELRVEYVYAPGSRRLLRRDVTAGKSRQRSELLESDGRRVVVHSNEHGSVEYAESSDADGSVTVTGPAYRKRMWKDARGQLTREIVEIGNPQWVSVDRKWNRDAFGTILREEGRVEASGTKTRTYVFERRFVDGGERLLLNENVIATMTRRGDRMVVDLPNNERVELVPRLGIDTFAAGKWQRGTTVRSVETVVNAQGQVRTLAVSMSGTKSTSEYEYQQGRLFRVADGSVSVELNHATTGRLENIVRGTQKRVIVDEASAIIVSGDGARRKYEVDRFGRVVKVGVTSLALDGAGRVVAWSGSTAVYDERNHLMATRTGQQLRARLRGLALEGENPLLEVTFAGTVIGHVSLDGKVDVGVPNLAQLTQPSTIDDPYAAAAYRSVLSGELSLRDVDLTAMGGRLYSAELGRFSSPDLEQIGNPEACVDDPIGCDLFAFAGGDPVNYFDPSGEVRIIWTACNVDGTHCTSWTEDIPDIVIGGGGGGARGGGRRDPGARGGGASGPNARPNRPPARPRFPRLPSQPGALDRAFDKIIELGWLLRSTRLDAFVMAGLENHQGPFVFEGALLFGVASDAGLYAGLLGGAMMFGAATSTEFLSIPLQEVTLSAEGFHSTTLNITELPTEFASIGGFVTGDGEQGGFVAVERNHLFVGIGIGVGGGHE